MVRVGPPFPIHLTAEVQKNDVLAVWLYADPLCGRLNQRSSQRAQRLAEEVADLIGAPCRPFSGGVAQGSCGSVVIPCQNGALYENRALREWQLIEPDTHLLAARTAY